MWTCGDGRIHAEGGPCCRGAAQTFLAGDATPSGLAVNRIGAAHGVDAEDFAIGIARWRSQAGQYGEGEQEEKQDLDHGAVCSSNARRDVNEEPW